MGLLTPPSPRAWALPGLSAFMLLLSSAGCGATGERGAGEVVDSAGVAIATSRQPSWRPGEEWRLDSVPLLDVGSLTDSIELTDLGDLVLRSDGSFVAADEDDNSLWFVDTAGQLVAKTGRKGEGPGEFEWLTRVVGSDDSVFVWDYSRRRLTAFDRTGKLGGTRRVTFRGTYTAPRFEGKLDDDQWLFVEGSSVSSGDAIALKRGTIAVIRVDAGGAGDTVLGRWPGLERMAVTSRRIVASLELPYARRSTVRWKRDGFWVGTSDRAQIDAFDASGNLTRSIRWSATPVPVGADELARWKRKGLESAVGAPPEFSVPFAAAYDKVEFPSHRPSFSTFLVDSEERLWVKRVPRWDALGEPGEWDVFAPEGAWLGVVEVPGAFTPRGIAGSRMIGEWSDDNELRRVRVYRIMRRE